MNAINLSAIAEINLDEKLGARRLTVLIRFLRGEISINELEVKLKKPLPAKLLELKKITTNGYLPKLTQQGLGKKLGCTYAAVQTWETAKKPAFPRLTTFLKIAKCCNLTGDELTDLLFDYSDVEQDIKPEEPLSNLVTVSDYKTLEQFLGDAVKFPALMKSV